VVEVGPGEQIQRHRDLMRRKFAASHYLSVDLRKESERFGAVNTDALSFFSLFQTESVDVILAFGVFNEPMSLQFPALSPPRFYIPARRPDNATRAHCEHEYVRRLAREMFRALKPGGVLLGDGLHSRGFEMEVETYLRFAGFTPDTRGLDTLSNVALDKFSIRDPFFFVKEVREGRSL
jgi:SAM-dependent methyltransferase